MASRRVMSGGPIDVSFVKDHPLSLTKFSMHPNPLPSPSPATGGPITPPISPARLQESRTQNATGYHLFGNRRVPTGEHGIHIGDVRHSVSLQAQTLGIIKS
ncbi:putative beta-D-xylosidase 2, partial [Cucurbita argyrosperma subsp. sororia]